MPAGDSKRARVPTAFTAAVTDRPPKKKAPRTAGAPKAHSKKNGKSYGEYVIVRAAAMPPTVIVMPWV